MKKQVNYKINGEEWEKAKDTAFTKLQKKVKVDGFRQGKVPRNVFEKKFGTGDILSTAMEDVLDKKYTETIMNEKLIPVLEPKLEIVSLDDKGFEANVTFILDPEVTLGEYKGLKVKKSVVKVTKEEIEHQISHILDKYAELVSKDGKVEEGNTVIIDFKGFKDNEAFEGGSAENYSLEIGSHSFIPGFEEAIVGMKKDDSKDINLTFPEDYGVKELAGQDVVFNVLVHDVKERIIPELDEDFFKDLDMEGVTSKEELEAKVKEEIKASKEHEAEEKFIRELLEKASSNMKADIDEEIIDAQRDRIYDEFVKRLASQGINEELYFTYTNTNKEDTLKEMRKEAETRLKNSYLLDEVAKAEKIDVTDKETEDELDKIAEMYGISKEEVLNQIGSTDAIKFDIRMRKALDILKENN